MKRFCVLLIIAFIVITATISCNKFEPNPIIRSWSNTIATYPMGDTALSGHFMAIDTIYFVSLNGVDCQIDSMSVEFYNGSSHIGGYDIMGFDFSPLMIHGGVDSLNIPTDTTMLYNAYFAVTDLVNNYMSSHTSIPSVRAQFYFYGTNFGGNKLFIHDGFAMGLINPFYN